VNRLVVVSPHPDDEVLAAGGLMRRHARRGGNVVIVAVTDGEASHSRSLRITPDELRVIRAKERAEALERLDVHATVVRLASPDQGCATHVPEIAGALAPLLRRGDTLIGPSAADRHPDHVAVSTALRDAARGLAGVIWEVPTWALVHRTAPRPTVGVLLDDEEWAAKRDAVAAYSSQLVPLGPDPVDGPVVHPHELTAMLRRLEGLFAVSV